MKAEHRETFKGMFTLFIWFRNARRFHLKQLRLVREGKLQIPQAEWSSRMRRCGYCKQRMQELIRSMENVVRPYSRYLSEYRSCR